MSEPRGRAGSVVLALVPALVVVATSWFVYTFAGDYETLGRLYRPLMNAAVLLRMFGMFGSVLLVWGALRTRGAGRGLLALAILSGPVAYGIVAAIVETSYFPLGQALYYGINPMFVAAIAGQCAAAGVGEALWRWLSRRRGRQVKWPVTGGVLAAIIGGLAVVFFTVLFQGGVPFFYVYQRGYLLLFT